MIKIYRGNFEFFTNIIGTGLNKCNLLILRWYIITKHYYISMHEIKISVETFIL